MSNRIANRPDAVRRSGRPSCHFRGRREHTEVGAVIILALVYIVSISLVVGALADWAMNDLNNTVKFKSVSSLDYAVTSAVQVAVQSIRYTPLMSQTASPAVGECWTPASGSVSQLTVNNDTVAVWCTTVQNLASAATRVVTFYACTGAAAASGVACASPNADLLTAVVTFDDYPPGGGAPLSTTCSAGQCGQGATTDQWTWTA
ncbi:MAG TPA: hypothetical protein VNF05_10080 [Acidimicrobiales bacterium]|nr:hypothetical protein [Acidimicrobiales bacterium]